MRVNWLSLNNFRIFERQLFELMPGLNIFYGPNAKGKTTLLEAVFLCSVGQSFRTAQLAELVRRQAPGFAVEMSYEKCGIMQSVKVCAAQSEKYVLLNGTKQPLSCLYGGLTAVASIPEDVQLIKGAPAHRRDYLDCQLQQVDPLYNHHLRRYARALKQRNILLKNRSVDTLESWEYELAHSASYLMRQRNWTVSMLSPKFKAIYSHLCGSESDLTLRYKPGISAAFQIESLEEGKEALRKMWRGQRDRDLFLGATQSGPHKDDFNISLNQLEMRHFASEGEQRSAAIALRLSEWELIDEGNEGEQPLLLIDDLGYGLDASRQKKLIEWLQKAGQVLLTTTERLALDQGHYFQMNQ